MERLPPIYRLEQVLQEQHDAGNATGDLESAQMYLRTGVDFAQSILRVVHGDWSGYAKRHMATLRDVNHWCKAAEQPALALFTLDRAWYDWWYEHHCPIAALGDEGNYDGSMRGVKRKGPKSTKSRTN